MIQTYENHGARTQERSKSRGLCLFIRSSDMCLLIVSPSFVDCILFWMLGWFLVLKVVRVVVKVAVKVAVEVVVNVVAKAARCAWCSGSCWSTVHCRWCLRAAVVPYMQSDHQGRHCLTFHIIESS